MSQRDDADVVPIDKVGDRIRDKVKRKKQDARAEALAAQFHRAMGWTPETANKGKGKGKRKKKRS